ncbi:MAG: porin [Pseudomonadota bacterium]
MNKYLLGGAAIAGLLLASAPAQAQMELTIGGHTKNYIGFLDQDDAPGNDTRDFDMQRETEIHVNGESTLDNGLTFGFQVEMEADSGDDDNTLEESYIYLSGAFGRLNLGAEDGAAYLLQVAAPSADSNIDGIRQYIQPVNYTAAGITLTNASAGRSPGDSNSQADGFDYDMDITGSNEKITYLSPNFNGFQFGASYTSEIGDLGSADNISTGFNTDDDADDLGEAYEVALRYEGVFSNLGFAFGAGYIHAEVEDDATVEGDYDAFNVGLDVDAGPFGFGVVYLDEDQEQAVTAGSDSDVNTIVVGVDYTTGPFKFGASYYNQDDETFGTDELETDRYTGGVIYTAGPGLSFRGSISHIDHEAGSDDVDATSFLGGVQINF